MNSMPCPMHLKPVSACKFTRLSQSSQLVPKVSHSFAYVYLFLDRQLDGWMDGWIDGLQTDGYTDR